MKKLSAFLCLFSALQANAIVGGRGNQAMHTLSTMGPFSVSGTTTSLPCLVIEGIEIDLKTPEAQERLEGDAWGY